MPVDDLLHICKYYVQFRFSHLVLLANRPIDIFCIPGIAKVLLRFVL